LPYGRTEFEFRNDYLDYDVTELELGPAIWQDVFSADRTENVKTRFDPMTQEKRGQPKSERRGFPKSQPYVDLPPVPKQWGTTQRTLAEKQNKPTEAIGDPVKEIEIDEPRKSPHTAPPRILKRPNPYTREELGQTANDPSSMPAKNTYDFKPQPNIRKSDFAVKGDPRLNHPIPAQVGRSPPKSTFTTNLRQKVNTRDVYEKVLSTDVTLPLGELLAVCPGVEKTFSDDTRLRTVPVTVVKAGEREDAPAVAYSEALQTFKDDQDNPIQDDNAITVFTQSSHLPNTGYPVSQLDPTTGNRNDPTRIDVASTGSLTMKIGHRVAVAMVDSGAEMNMITPELAEELRDYFAEDEAGAKFSMRNASGDVRPIRAKFNSVPCNIGGVDFDETFFVGDSWNSYFDIILGQSFLWNQNCRLEWDKNSGRSHIRMHRNGKENEPAIIFRLMKHRDRYHRERAAQVNGIETYHNNDEADEIREEEPPGTRRINQEVEDNIIALGIDNSGVVGYLSDPDDFLYFYDNSSEEPNGDDITAWRYCYTRTV
jgi:hypothetical protein